MDEMQYKLIESIIKGATEGTINAGSDLAKQTAVATLEKLKSAFGWKSAPKPEEAKALATKALADNPQLAKQVETILSDYRQKLGGVSIGTINAKTAISGVNNTFNAPTTFN